MMALKYSNVPYTASTDPRLQFDIYLPQSTSALRPLICFVHGGAWRSEDKSEHAVLAQKLVAATAASVVVANYRLTPQEPTPDTQFLHPGHAEDILKLLSFLVAWEGPTAQGKFSSMYLMGHSCGAHMLASIFLDSSHVTPSLTPSSHILLSVRGIMLSGGIYDIDSLLERFPSYLLWFIESAFGAHDSYDRFSVTNLPARKTSTRWLIAHSTDDELVDLTQSEAMFQHLRHLYAAAPQAESSIIQVIESFGQHGEMLETDAYVDTVAAFVRGGSRSTTL